MKINLLMLLLAALTPFCGDAQNLITNPGAESEPVGNGWTEASGTQWTHRANGNPPAYEGSWMFFAGPEAGTVELYQDVDVSAYATTIDNNTQPFKFEDYVRSYAQSSPDNSKVIVEYRNAGGTVLSSFDSGF